MPMNAAISRADLSRIAQGARAVADVLGGARFPIIARPEDEFAMAPFIDYRSADGLYRKCRIALTGGKPYACHMAISEHWMIHYLNADMRQRSERRAEAARFFAAFDGTFAVRHARARSLPSTNASASTTSRSIAARRRTGNCWCLKPAAT